MGSLGDYEINGSLQTEDSIVITKSEPITVRPATKTDDDGFYYLSNLDIHVNFILEMLFCFKADDDRRSGGVVGSDVFKSALSKVLVHYYPLAGVLTTDSDGRLTVECTGEGVQFVEAVADCDIDALGDISKRDPALLEKFAHVFPEATSTLQAPLLTLQVTRFRCGGFVIGAAFNHCISDGTSMTEFVNSWAEIVRGAALTQKPFLDRGIIRSKQPPKIEFPHTEYSVIDAPPGSFTPFEDHQLIFRSFSFTPQELSHLKEIAMADGVINKCTTFTVLTALSWRARTQAVGLSPNQKTILLFPVDSRSKFQPPLPKGYFGNAILLMHCVCSAGELIEKPLSFAVKLIQEAIDSVTDKYLRSSIDYFEVHKPDLTFTPATFVVSTWMRLSYEDIDFGVGAPTQIGPVVLPENLALYLPRGKGVTMLLGLPGPAMDIFRELIKY
ncbi:PREDICTED: omega-hydroxypalmitate O-feruloyl transferase-like [Nelumbo nucifera]|uniref:Omega-hydroxypalmitate O-feruloyl transferase-like n=1 Tax=Nelumbo nucifera TaxID=4432 RepID=A0A1U7ZG84_NELNU|nr:PREDICTED: omega-hydroxypalmitate O-feruloyl transferase-like [Nelumbo nucifera]